MHKDVKTQGNMISFDVKNGDCIKIMNNDDVMTEFIVPYDVATFKCYLSRLMQLINYK